MPVTRTRSLRTVWRMALVVALGGAVAGCVSDGQGPVASQSTPNGATVSGATVAFESIDGPPRPVFDRMVDILDSEAQLRNVAVVSRQSQAAYRVRGYLAAQTVRGRTSIDWVWDVYDRDQRRALRLAGTEPVNRTGGDAWAAADDVTLRRIAQAGLSGLSAVIGGSAAPVDAAPAAAPPARGPAIAANTDLAATPRAALGFASVDDDPPRAER
ncbi:MAG: hypothetical protein M9932_07740 [Xanthobacteraceae bacterium]|nr:hypothetical protein [Xanthobacteraceae bacterium]